MKVSTTLSIHERERIREIWNAVYPIQLMHHTAESFDKYLDGLEAAEHVFDIAQTPFDIAQTPNEVIQPHGANSALRGWLCTFNRNGERWFVIIVDSACARQGCGTNLLRYALEKYPKLSGWVVEHNDFKKHDGTPYLSPLGFYLKHGFKITDIRLENEFTSAVKITSI